jgi:capping protein alpha
MGDEEPTREDLCAIVKKFMLHAPPGEFMEVVTDIRGLVSDESIINDVVPEAFEGYNTEQMIAVDAGDHKVIVCKEGAAAPGEYLDPVGRDAVSFDHITRKITGHSDAGDHFSGKYEDVRSAAQRECEAYVADHYATGTGAVYNGTEGIVIAISSSKFEPRNFWTGSWRAVWRANFPAGAKGADLALVGTVNINVHFYEDGNVQLNANNQLEAKIKTGNSADATAAAIFKAIGLAEAKYQQSLEAAYATMDTSTFKALRRQLPVTASIIDWDKIGTGAHKIAAGAKKE